MPLELSRRDFFSACGILAASLAACSDATRRTRVASSFITDPPLDDYREPLAALIETALPIGHAGFPLDGQAVQSRLLRMFPLEDERRFLGFQRTLVYFDQLDLAPHVAAPLLAAERVALDVPERMPEHEFRLECARKIARESQACEQFVERFGSRSRFAPLPPDARLSWLRLWSASEFDVKRDFANTLRLLVQIAAYSSEDLWAVIGYEGPLIDRPERRA